ncbi:MAG: tetratricopeptide repeat protein, partial [Pseudomonadales bacterium]|nr:tetratricopeptide repeat protein [Pseudomonadales bacterium]
MASNEFRDDLGLHYSCRDADSIERFNLALESYLASRNDTMPALDELVARNEDMAMAHCFRGYLLKLASDPRFAQPIRDVLDRLGRQYDALNNREKQHVDVLRAWTRNRTDEALQRAESLLVDYPRDMLALRVAHYLHFYAGAAGDMRDSVSRSVAVWKPEEPFYGYLLGMLSFGLEEAGDYEGAERAGKQAVELNPGDIWAAHAVTHVFQMQHRFDEGIPWIEQLVPNWNRTNNFVYHLHWHKALLYLGLNRPDVALDIYDDLLEAPIADDFYLDVCNAASL